MEAKYIYNNDFKALIKSMKSPLSKKILEMEYHNHNHNHNHTFKENKYAVLLTETPGLIKLSSYKHNKKIKIGRFIKKLIKRISLFELESFVNEYKSFKCKGNFEIVKGSDISKYYDTKKYTKDYEKSCSLYESCMNNLPKSFFKIYEKNDNISLLILKGNDGKIKGRSIILSNVESMDGYKGLDIMLTPYVSHQYIKGNFKKYAEENNIFSIDDFSIGDKEIGLKVKLENTDFEDYPYVDYFSCLVSKYLCRKDSSEYDEPKICGIKLKKSYKCLSRTDGLYDIVEGIKYYETFEDFDKNNYKRTFDTSKISLCNVTNKYFLNRNIKKFKSVEHIEPPILKKIFGHLGSGIRLKRSMGISLGRPECININSNLYEISLNPNLNIDNFESKNFLIVFHHIFSNFFENDININKNKNYSLNLNYDKMLQDGFSCLLPFSSKYFKIKNGNLYVHFSYNKKVFFICFKSKPSGIVFEIYNSKIKNENVSLSYLLEIDSIYINKRISKMNKGQTEYSKLFEKLKSEILKIENNEK